jgi:hypothetical protein
MSENLLKDIWHPIEMIEGARFRALKLFWDIEKHHGEEAARAVFADLGQPPSRMKIKQLRKFDIVEQYDRMKEKNISALALRISQENKLLPKEERAGAGGVNPVALWKYIDRALKEREEGLKDGTWNGPRASDWTAALEYWDEADD